MSQQANKYLEECKEILLSEGFFSRAINPHISYGFPSKGSTSRNSKTIGQAWTTKDGKAVFISPALFTKDNHIQIIGVLIHELIHIELPKAGHKAPFKRRALELGLTGKMTATTVSDGLRDRLNSLPFPPQPVLPIDPSAHKKQGTRLIKLECECGRILRVSRKVGEEGGIICGLCDSIFMEI